MNTQQIFHVEDLFRMDYYIPEEMDETATTIRFVERIPGGFIHRTILKNDITKETTAISEVFTPDHVVLQSLEKDDTDMSVLFAETFLRRKKYLDGLKEIITNDGDEKKVLFKDKYETIANEIKRDESITHEVKALIYKYLGIGKEEEKEEQEEEQEEVAK